MIASKTILMLVLDKMKITIGTQEKKTIFLLQIKCIQPLICLHGLVIYSFNLVTRSNSNCTYENSIKETRYVIPT